MFAVVAHVVKARAIDKLDVKIFREPVKFLQACRQNQIIGVYEEDIFPVRNFQAFVARE